MNMYVSLSFIIGARDLVEKLEEAQFWKLIQISQVITVVDPVRTQSRGKSAVVLASVGAAIH